MSPLKERVLSALRWSERYTKTDMVYLSTSGWWMNLGTLVISVCSLALYIVFARVLPPEVYGTYQYLLSGAAIVGALTLTGLNGAVARAVARGHEGTVRKAVAVQIRWSIVPFLASCAVAAYYLLEGTLILALGFFLIGILAPIINTFSIYASFLQGKKDFRRGFWFGMGWNIPYYLALIATAFLSPTVLALLFASLGVQAAALGIAYARTLHAHRPNNKIDVEAISYGKHLSVMGLGGVVVTQIDTILAFHFLGPAAVALYSFATAIPERLSGFFKFIPSAALPKFSEKSPAQVRKAFGSRLWIAVLCMTLFAGAYALAAPFLFQILFPAYLESVPYSQLYALVIVASLGGLFTTALTAQRDLKGLYVFTVISPIVQIVLQVLGAVFYGLWGLIVARLAAQFFSLLLAALLLFKRTKGSYGDIPAA